MSASSIGGSGWNTTSAEWVRRGDVWFFVGCMMAGSLFLGIAGVPLLIFGLFLLRKAQLNGGLIRPWAVTIVVGLIVVDSSVNLFARDLDLLPANKAFLVRSLWIDYGLFSDGGFALYYNLPFPIINYSNGGIGGVAVPIEKCIRVASAILVMPIRIAAAWGLLRLRHWGLQWSILGNWLSLTLWVIYAPAMAYQYDLRFGTSEFGALGFWLIGGLPFLGPLVLLPYLHTVNRNLWIK